VFPNVPPGDYTLEARTVDNVTWDGAIHQNVALGVPKDLEPTMWASVPVTVGNTAIDNLVVNLRPAFRVSGRLDFGGSAPPDQDAIVHAGVTFSPATGGEVPGWQIRIRIDPEGQFVATGFTPGAWLPRARINVRGWSFESAFLDGRDITGQAFDIGTADLQDLVLKFRQSGPSSPGAAENSK
jgi:hypothetical protein